MSKNLPYDLLVAQYNVYELVSLLEGIDHNRLTPMTPAPAIVGERWRVMDANVYAQYEAHRNPEPAPTPPRRPQPREFIDEVPAEEQDEFRAQNMSRESISETAIEFSPSEPKHTIYVFADVTCKHCHQIIVKDVPELMKRGIRVRFLAMPLAGPNSKEGKLMANIWCSPNKHLDLASAAAGKAVAPHKCDEPIVATHYALSRRLGITGSPGIVTESGAYIGGYLTPSQILEKLEPSG